MWSFSLQMQIQSCHALQYLIDLAKVQMQARPREKTFHRSSNTQDRQQIIFNLQVLQELAQKLHFRPCTSTKAKGRSASKGKQSTKRSQKSKPQSKSKPAKQSCGKKEKKGNPHAQQEKQQKYLQRIANSQAYKALRSRYLALKNQQFSARRELKKEIEGIDQNIRAITDKDKQLDRMRRNLAMEVNSLSRTYNELRLDNYQLHCELNARRGYQSQGYYDSEPNIEEGMDYQELLELQQQMGSVEVGYPAAIVQNMPFTQFKGETGEEKCCICCVEFEEDQAVFKTECKHLHHHECLQKWLRIKRICPLCRQEVRLT